MTAQCNVEVVLQEKMLRTGQREGILGWFNIYNIMFKVLIQPLGRFVPSNVHKVPQLTCLLAYVRDSGGFLCLLHLTEFCITKSV